MVASDHSPSPPALKQTPSAFAAWGGIAGAQTLLPLTLDEAERRRSALATSGRRDLGLPRAPLRGSPGKGSSRVGHRRRHRARAPDAPWTLAAGDLRSRHPLSPFVGRELRHRVIRTLVRGHTVQLDGQLVGDPTGRLVRPARARRDLNRPTRTP